MFPVSFCSIVSCPLILYPGPCCSLPFVFHHLQRGLLRGPGWAESNLSVLAGHMIENLPKFPTSTTNFSQQLEARGFPSWQRVRTLYKDTLCADSTCSGLKPHVTGKPEPAQSLCASSAVPGLQQRCFLPTAQGRFWVSLYCVSVAEGFSNA